MTKVNKYKYYSQTNKSTNTKVKSTNLFIQTGKYLIIQMDHGNDPINLKEVTAYGAMTFE